MSEGIIKSKEMMLSGDMPNNGNVWQTTEPVKLENKGTSWWYALLACFFRTQPCNRYRRAKVQNHPRVTKVRAPLHVHVRTLTQLATWGFWVNLHLVYLIVKWALSSARPDQTLKFHKMLETTHSRIMCKNSHVRTTELEQPVQFPHSNSVECCANGLFSVLRSTWVPNKTSDKNSKTRCRGSRLAKSRKTR